MSNVDDKVQKNIKDLVQDISKNPNHWQAYVDLISLLTVTDELVTAEELALKSLSLFKDNNQAQQALLYATGNVYYTATDYARAATFFDKITDEKLQHDAIVMQAQSFYAQNKFKQALVFALTATQQDAHDIKIQVLLGNIWLSLGDLSNAKKVFESVLHLDEQNYAANFGLGLITQVTMPKDNPWLMKAKQINSKQYQQDASRLDELITIMLGSQKNGIKPE